MTNDHNTIQISGPRGSAQAYAIRDFLHRSGLPFQWIELGSDDQARALQVNGLADDRLPVCVFPDGTRLEKE